jgi:predicted Abi (CAAX) family protease
MGTILHRVKLGAWRWPHLALALVTALLVVMVGPWRLVASDGTPASNYEKAQAQPFNQVTTYPISPLPSSPLLQPNGDWIGRLILPSVEEYQQKPGDWVWMEVWHSLAGLPDLTGQRVKLTWKPSPMNQAYLDQVTRDIDFSDQATKFLENGNIVPTRLNGRRQVGPLQSLAGARPQDDMTVRLVEPDLVREDGQWVLRTGLEPIQITGREYGLVKILGPDTGVTAPPPADCPGPTPCPGEYFRVQFFNPSSKSFSGPTGTVRIPQQPRMKGDRFFSNLQDLENSPAGVEGWYIYGSRDSQGLFTVQALKPRALFRLQPDQVILTEREGLKYLDRGNWKETPQRKGTLQRVLISPNAGSSDAARAQWQEGDRALVIHLFGGIGGDNKELTPLGTVTGHFAYGLAQVKREPITQELQFAIQYQQIYAHNSGGVVSGTHDWHEYMGDLQRGWMGLRPVSDVVIKLDAFIEPFQFGDTRISLFRELLIQAQVLAARYRTGDGTGVAAVTPATSCVQDYLLPFNKLKTKLKVNRRLSSGCGITPRV